jgi:hypothetical protein
MTDDLYTDEIRGFLLNRQWPKGLIVDTAVYDNHIAIVLYRDNFNAFDGVDKLSISKLMGETINALRKQGCPTFMEVRSGTGRIER